jgi:hypothetical protein
VIIKGTVSKRLIAYIERVAEHLGLEYDMIEVVIKKTCSANAGGYCHGYHDDIQIEIARNDDVGRIPYETLKQNIAHEFIHAQQLVTGRMVNIGLMMSTDGDSITFDNKVIWEGKDYINEPYDTQPWEIDAYAREESVYKECK